LDPNLKEPNGAYSSYVVNYQLVYQNGTPFQLNAQNLPAKAWVAVHYTGLYLQDSWSVGRRVTLNLGVRYAHDNGFIPALLILDLMSRKGKTLHELLKPLREKYFISGEINTKLKSMDEVLARLAELAGRYKDGHTYTLDGLIKPRADAAEELVAGLKAMTADPDAEGRHRLRLTGTL